MTAKENKEAIRRLFNMLSAGDWSNADEIMDNNFVYRSTAGEEYHGIDGADELVNTYFEAFENLELSLKDLVAEGDKVFFTYRQTGTHTGELMGIEPSNKKMDLLIASICTFKNGKLVEQFDIYDTLELLKQLDAVSEDVRPGGGDWPTGNRKLRPQ